MWLFKILLRFSLWLLTVWQWCYLGAIFFCFCVYHISASLSFFNLWGFFKKSILENVWPFSLRIFLLFHFLSPLLELQLHICRNFTYAPHVSYFKCSSSLCSIVCSYLSYLPLCCCVYLNHFYPFDSFFKKWLRESGEILQPFLYFHLLS